MSEVKEKIVKTITEHLGVDADQVIPEARIVEDLGADSLDVVELVMAFEEAFNIEIPESAAEKLVTVKDVTDYIQKVTQR